MVGSTIVPVTTPIAVPTCWPVMPTPVPQGWECPKCHHIYAPSVHECLGCQPAASGTTIQHHPGFWYSVHATMVERP